MAAPIIADRNLFYEWENKNDFQNKLIIRIYTATNRILLNW